jgi:regulator of sigma E protease
LVLVVKKYTLLEAIPAGFTRCWETLQNYIVGLKQIIHRQRQDANESLGSVISIGNTFPSVWDWERSGH